MCYAVFGSVMHTFNVIKQKEDVCMYTWMDVVQVDTLISGAKLKK